MALFMQINWWLWHAFKPKRLLLWEQRNRKKSFVSQSGFGLLLHDMAQPKFDSEPNSQVSATVQIQIVHSYIAKRYMSFKRSLCGHVFEVLVYLKQRIVKWDQPLGSWVPRGPTDTGQGSQNFLHLQATKSIYKNNRCLAKVFWFDIMTEFCI